LVYAVPPLALLVCLSCSSKTSTDTKTSKTSTDTKTSKTSTDMDTSKTSTDTETCRTDQISEITLERWGRFSQLPSYKVVLRSDETVLYNGREFVDKKGKHIGKLGKFYFNKLSKLIESEGYFKMRERYPEDAVIEDGYDARVKVKCGDKEKVVFDNA